MPREYIKEGSVSARAIVGMLQQHSLQPLLAAAVIVGSIPLLPLKLAYKESNGQQDVVTTTAVRFICEAWTFCCFLSWAAQQPTATSCDGISRSFLVHKRELKNVEK
jgi:hypothetical protein